MKAHIKMEKAITKFGDNGIEIQKFHRPISIEIGAHIEETSMKLNICLR